MQLRDGAIVFREACLAISGQLLSKDEARWIRSEHRQAAGAIYYAERNAGQF